MPLHKHTVEEAVLMLEGTIWMQIGNDQYTVGPDESAIIPPDTA
ncbi:MAG TPA: cupin domain-containing protein [Acidobacteriaceae bacterium]|nr:cupin domain-containing protein [Acidobacteriaceae bacterium]